jgi:hypothetical protein
MNEAQTPTRTVTFILVLLFCQLHLPLRHPPVKPLSIREQAQWVRPTLHPSATAQPCELPPSAHHVDHVALVITSVSTLLRKEEAAAPANVHTSQRCPDPNTGLLAPRSPYRYNRSTCALRLADLHPPLNDKQEEGGWRPSCGGRQRDTE